MTQATSPAGGRFPSWQADVQAAVRESDPEKLLERVHTAEIAIFNRQQVLARQSTDSSDPVEREALAEAQETLRLLKRDRLGFPDWNQDHK